MNMKIVYNSALELREQSLFHRNKRNHQELCIAS